MSYGWLRAELQGLLIKKAKIKTTIEGGREHYEIWKGQDKGIERDS